MTLLSSLRGYRREWIVPDVRAAAVLLAIAVPGQLATSRLAGMPPVTGYFAFVAGTALFALLGSNPQMSVGADSTIAPLFAVGVAHLAPLGSARYVDLVGMLAMIAGLFVALVGLLRLGWIAEFLSTPIITGFLAGVAVIIVIHQLPDLFGIPGSSGSDVQRIGAIAGHLGKTNGWSLGIGLGVLIVAVAAERFGPQIPGALVALVLSGGAVGVLGLHRHGVAVLGSFAHSAPRLGLVGLSWSALGSIVPLGAVVALVVISQTAVTTRAFSSQAPREVDVGRDFLGVGAGSIVAGLLGSFPVDASPPNTAASLAAGGRTQVTGLLAAAALALLIPVSGVLKDVPLATLAGVLVSIAVRLFHVRDFVSIARFNRFEFALASLTLLTVALVGVEQGIGLAVGLAVLERARLSARPQLHVLGRMPHSTSWIPLSRGRGATQVPGVLAVLFATPLWYANVGNFSAEVVTAMDRAIGPLRVMVLDAIGMSDIDYSGSCALRELLDELDRNHVAFAMARVGEQVVASLARSGLLERIGKDRLFPSVNAAVSAMRKLELDEP